MDGTKSLGVCPGCGQFDMLERELCAGCECAAPEDRSHLFVRVWQFEDAPVEYRRLSRHGGDEDWLAFVPAELAGVSMNWMGEGTAFGCCDVSAHEVPGGVVHIGAHA